MRFKGHYGSNPIVYAQIWEDLKIAEALDSAALAHDRRIHPKAANNHRGEPRWEGSDAERLLRQDMDEGKHKTMKPQLLYNMRNEYYENYPLKIFREHIYQEEKRRKFLAIRLSAQIRTEIQLVVLLRIVEY
jgi:hypothetical protein